MNFLQSASDTVGGGHWFVLLWALLKTLDKGNKAILPLPYEAWKKWMCSLPGTRSLQELCLFALAKRDEFRRDLPTLLRDLGRGDGRLSARLFSDTMAMRMPSTFRLINYVECLWTVSGDNRLMRHEADKDYSFTTSWPYGRDLTQSL